jgi:ABC-2 type transport system ATP-binding protein
VRRLECFDLAVSYGQVRALRGASLRLEQGVTGLVGPNGAGKSTLLRAMSLIQKADSGRVEFDGTVLTGRGVDDFRRNLGYLPQQPRWHSWMTVEDVVSVFAWMRKVPKAGRASAVIETLERVALADLRDVESGSLSGGQYQRLMLATCLVAEPEVLLLDEPTVGLDPEQRYEFRSLVRSLAHDRAVCISTHLMDDVATSADRVAVLHEGRLIFDGTTRELLSRTQASPTGDATDFEAAYLQLLRSHR